MRLTKVWRSWRGPGAGDAGGFDSNAVFAAGLAASSSFPSRVANTGPAAVPELRPSGRSGWGTELGVGVLARLTGHNAQIPLRALGP
jgi:hypothetical protein